MVGICGAVKVAESVEITDRDSAKAWLEPQDHQTRVWFASRCALRALPHHGTFKEATPIGLSLATCRALLVSSSATNCTIEEMRKLESIARSAGSTYSPETAFSSAHLAATNAAYSVAAVARASRRSKEAYRSASNATNSAVATAAACNYIARDPSEQSFSESDAWAAATFDANHPKSWGRLWLDAPQPYGLAQAGRRSKPSGRPMARIGPSGSRGTRPCATAHGPIGT
jgi:hypothetical protein